VRRSGFVAPSGTGLLRLLPVKGVTTLLIASRPKIKGIRTRLGRYGGNNEDFVLVGLRRRGKSAGVQDAIEGGVEATVEAIK